MSWSVIIADENPRTMTWMDACVSLTTFPSERHLGGKKDRNKYNFNIV